MGDFWEGEALCEKALRYALEIDDTVSKASLPRKELIPLTGVIWTHLGLDKGISLLAKPTPG
jgi:hypothetical protein